MKTRWTALSAALLISAAGAACSDDTAGLDEPGSGIFTVDVVGERFRVRIDDPAIQEQARRILRGQEPQKIITGTLVAGDGGFNTGYSWHLQPESVDFAEVTIELCDGRPSFVEEELQYWLGTVGYYCPWGTQLVEEIR